MLELLSANIGTIATGLAVFIIVMLALRKLLRDGKNGGCGCGCSNCSDCTGCRK